jgi:hypothetical protein
MPQSKKLNVTARRTQLFALLVASLALGLFIGGVLAWLPLAAIVLAWAVWRAGDRQIREVLSDPYDAHAASASLHVPRR